MVFDWIVSSCVLLMSGIEEKRLSTNLLFSTSFILMSAEVIVSSLGLMFPSIKPRTDSWIVALGASSTIFLSAVEKDTFPKVISTNRFQPSQLKVGSSSFN